MKLTPLFPPSVEPVRVGVYPVEFDGDSGTYYSLWSGDEWKVCCTTPELAATQAVCSWDCYSDAMRGWRGLAKPPKGA